ncbi:MAG: nucleotidyltransferase family protein [Clostridiales bacterium]|nr:nucleotidyltransferase family protein [Clostridiales bacterium]
MNIAGVISEYNPFHKGHAYHIAQTRAMLGADTGIVCVMSGNYVQRGEPAVFEKHARALAAILTGADLVLELPLPFVLSSAEGFADGAVALLDKLKCVDYLSFGSESGEIHQLKQAAELLLDPRLIPYLKEALKTGVSYAEARQTAAEALFNELYINAAARDSDRYRKLNVMSAPNNILAIEYIKSVLKRKSQITPVTVKRIGAGHDEADHMNGPASASRLRQKLREGLDIWDDLPMSAMIVFREELESGFAPVIIDTLETAVLSKLRTMSADDFMNLPDASEGLGLRLMKYAREGISPEAILDKAKTKRYARSRIRRMLMCAYLGITNDSKPEAPPYARVLACNARGRSIINLIDNNMPVITKPAGVRRLGGAAEALFELEARSTDLYVLGYPNESHRAGGQEWKIGPEIV